MTVFFRTCALSAVALAAALLAACGPPTPEKETDAPAPAAPVSSPLARDHAAPVANTAPAPNDPNAARLAAEAEAAAQLRLDVERAREAVRQIQTDAEIARQQTEATEREAARVRAVEDQTRAIDEYNATLRQQTQQYEQQTRRAAEEAALLEKQRRQVIVSRPGPARPPVTSSPFSGSLTPPVVPDLTPPAPVAPLIAQPSLSEPGSTPGQRQLGRRRPKGQAE